MKETVIKFESSTETPFKEKTARRTRISSKVVMGILNDARLSPEEYLCCLNAGRGGE